MKAVLCQIVRHLLSARTGFAWTMTFPQKRVRSCAQKTHLHHSQLFHGNCLSSLIVEISTSWNHTLGFTNGLHVGIGWGESIPVKD